ncbi:cytokinesis protein 3 [Smittium mucronatum]|uniref:Cytokinesis protein 3 n=1 Tax=Smittium mucronatum TaxID=133383 RepID=A0A1R0GZ20_9FUNG|nr:cytokinesis protein 3 [Smittium mucronatum]
MSRSDQFMYVKALYDFIPESPDDLPFVKGDKNWWKGRFPDSTKIGYFPSCVVEFHDPYNSQNPPIKISKTAQKLKNLMHIEQQKMLSSINLTSPSSFQNFALDSEEKFDSEIHNLQNQLLNLANNEKQILKNETDPEMIPFQVNILVKDRSSSSNPDSAKINSSLFPDIPQPLNSFSNLNNPLQNIEPLDNISSQDFPQQNQNSIRNNFKKSEKSFNYSFDKNSFSINNNFPISSQPTNNNPTPIIDRRDSKIFNIVTSERSPERKSSSNSSLSTQIESAADDYVRKYMEDYRSEIDLTPRIPSSEKKLHMFEDDKNPEKLNILNSTSISIDHIDAEKSNTSLNQSNNNNSNKITSEIPSVVNDFSTVKPLPSPKGNFNHSDSKSKEIPVPQNILNNAICAEPSVLDKNPDDNSHSNFKTDSSNNELLINPSQIQPISSRPIKNSNHLFRQYLLDSGLLNISQTKSKPKEPIPLNSAKIMPDKNESTQGYSQNARSSLPTPPKDLNSKTISSNISIKSAESAESLGLVYKPLPTDKNHSISSIPSSNSSHENLSILDNYSDSDSEIFNYSSSHDELDQLSQTEPSPTVESATNSGPRTFPSTATAFRLKGPRDMNSVSANEKEYSSTPEAITPHDVTNSIINSMDGGKKPQNFQNDLTAQSFPSPSPTISTQNSYQTQIIDNPAKYNNYAKALPPIPVRLKSPLLDNPAIQDLHISYPIENGFVIPETNKSHQYINPVPRLTSTQRPPLPNLPSLPPPSKPIENIQNNSEPESLFHQGPENRVKTVPLNDIYDSNTIQLRSIHTFNHNLGAKPPSERPVSERKTLQTKDVPNLQPHNHLSYANNQLNNTAKINTLTGGGAFPNKFNHLSSPSVNYGNNSDIRAAAKMFTPSPFDIGFERDCYPENTINTPPIVDEDNIPIIDKDNTEQPQNVFGIDLGSIKIGYPFEKSTLTQVTDPDLAKPIPQKVEPLYILSLSSPVILSGFKPSKIENTNWDSVDQAIRLLNTKNVRNSIETVALVHLKRQFGPDPARLARAIYIWITTYVQLDTAIPEDSKPTDIKLHLNELPDKVFESRLSRGPGFAYLFYEMSKLVGLDCQVVHGTLKLPAPHPDSLLWGPVSPLYPNHAWNAICIDGEYRFIDAACASISHPLNLLACRDDNFFLTPPKNLIFTHFPFESKSQFLNPVISWPLFWQLPYVRPSFFHDRVNILKMASSHLMVKNGELVSLVMSLGSKQLSCYVEVEMFDDNSIKASTETLRYPKPSSKHHALAQSMNYGDKRMTKAHIGVNSSYSRGAVKIYTGIKPFFLPKDKQIELLTYMASFSSSEYPSDETSNMNTSFDKNSSSIGGKFFKRIRSASISSSSRSSFKLGQSKNSESSKKYFGKHKRISSETKLKPGEVLNSPFVLGAPNSVTYNLSCVLPLYHLGNPSFHESVLTNHFCEFDFYIKSPTSRIVDLGTQVDFHLLAGFNHGSIRHKKNIITKHYKMQLKSPSLHTTKFVFQPRDQSYTLQHTVRELGNWEIQCHSDTDGWVPIVMYQCT